MVLDALRLMLSKGFLHLPIVDGSRRILGLVDVMDIVGLIMNDGGQQFWQEAANAAGELSGQRGLCGNGTETHLYSFVPPSISILDDTASEVSSAQPARSLLLQRSSRSGDPRPNMDVDDDVFLESASVLQARQQLRPVGTRTSSAS